MRVNEGCHCGRLSFGISSNNKHTFSMLFNCPRFPFACLLRINFGGLLLFCFLQHCVDTLGEKSLLLWKGLYHSCFVTNSLQCGSLLYLKT